MFKEIFTTFGIIGVLVFLIAVIIFAPFATLWSLNTLFNLGIAYTFKTWLATVWIQMVTFGSVTHAVNAKAKTQ